jgi:HSP20 family molecular chaperone IbpA
MSNDLNRPANSTTAAATRQPVERLVFTPPIDIYETDEGLILRADLPGVSLETLELQVQDNKLTLFGRMEPVVPENARLIHQEYETGDYLRSFILSDEVNHERISAKLSNGVLEVVLPKAEKAVPRRIQIQSN